MLGEYATAVFLFFDGGIYIECEEDEIGKFVKAGDGNAIVEVINKIDEDCNPNIRFQLTEEGKKLVNEVTRED